MKHENMSYLNRIPLTFEYRFKSFIDKELIVFAKINVSKNMKTNKTTVKLTTLSATEYKMMTISSHWEEWVPHL